MFYALVDSNRVPLLRDGEQVLADTPIEGYALLGAYPGGLVIDLKTGLEVPRPSAGERDSAAEIRRAS